MSSITLSGLSFPITTLKTNQEKDQKVVFFCTHKGGDESIFSNWYPMSIKIDVYNLMKFLKNQKIELSKDAVNWLLSNKNILDQISFANNEIFMFAFIKALIFPGDTKTITSAYQIYKPNEAKTFGRKVPSFNNEVWDRIKFPLSIYTQYHKFSQSHNAKKATIDLILLGCDIVEASHYDQIWGIGLSIQNPKILDINKWQGLNLLGKSIVKAIKIIINENKMIMDLEMQMKDNITKISSS